jgi:bifunctional non-homologous end joining protein LigD
LPLLEQATQQADAIGRLYEQASMVAWLAEAYLAAGRPEPAVEMATRAFQLADQSKQRGKRAHSLRVLGETFGAGTPARLDEAEACYESARELAAQLAARLPELVVDRTSRALRKRKVLVDWIQNDPSRSTVAPYSLRTGPSPGVSTPLTSNELESEASLAFGPEAVLERVARLGDLFAPVLSLEQRLPG